MAELKNWYLVAYDIRDRSRWRKAYRLLEGYGERVQYSIFRCWLNQREREKLRWELEKVLSEEDDLLLVRLSRRCVEQLVLYNRADAWPPPPEGHRIF